ncbi:hypothetical protein C8R44DRAFT_852194 [Mycena epipterygia]|nr:hypothetical protein C8R44DRAFT_852194 [Mycena epipterygia]
MSLTSKGHRRAREDSVESFDAPPRNRPRLEDQTLVDPENEEVVRDSAFYRRDGDCILRVENTLFKVHRHLLNHEGSAFTGLFSLPSGPESTFEGETDSDPIRLWGDTVEQMRAFFGYAYSSPLVLQYSQIRSAEINRLIHAARFTHKYRLEAFERWATQAIAHVCGRRDYAIFQTCTPGLYVRLLELDRLCPLAAVKASIRKSWVKRLRDNDPSLRLAYALDKADKLGFRDLLGDLYYLQLQRLDDPVADIPTTQAAPPLPAELSDVHKLRLLTGYRSLSLCWRRIAADPPMLNACHRCCIVWDDVWVREAKTLPNGADPVERLNELRRALSTACSRSGCLMGGVEKAFSSLLKTLRASMADHFLGPPATP